MPHPGSEEPLSEPAEAPADRQRQADGERTDPPHQPTSARPGGAQRGAL